MIIAEDAVVVVDYAIKDVVGSLLEDSDDEPLAYIHGAGTLAPGLEKALEGQKEGDRVSVTLRPEKAFGVRNEKLIREVDLGNFEDPNEVREGLVFHADLDGTVRFYTVVKVEDDVVVIDGNHPFADQTLTFDVTVKEVREATSEEIEHGHVHGEHGHHH